VDPSHLNAFDLTKTKKKFKVKEQRNKTKTQFRQLVLLQKPKLYFDTPKVEGKHSNMDVR